VIDTEFRAPYTTIMSQGTCHGTSVVGRPDARRTVVTGRDYELSAATEFSLPNFAIMFKNDMP
jgi:hypothetical protein